MAPGINCYPIQEDLEGLPVLGTDRLLISFGIGQAFARQDMT
jgi:hypothetical protein